MIAQTRPSLHAPEGTSSIPSIDLLHAPAARQALDDLLAVQMQLELATGVPVAIYGPVGQTVPGISPIKPRLAEQPAPQARDLLAPQDWPRHNGQMLEVVSSSNLHYFVTPFILCNTPIAQIILGPLQLFEPGTRSVSRGAEASGQPTSTVGVPVLASWKAQAAAELARILVSRLSPSLVDIIPQLPAPEPLLPPRGQDSTALTPSGNTLRSQRGTSPRLGALAHDALLPEKTTPEQLQKVIESTAMLHTPPEDQNAVPSWPAPARPLSAPTHETESGRGPARLLRHLIEAMPQAVIVSAAPDGQIVLANRAARERWPQWLGGPTPDNAASGPLRYRVTAENYPSEWLGLRVALRQAEPFRGEVCVETTEGEAPEQHPLLVSAFPLPTAQENAGYAIAIFEDLSGLVERERFKDELLLLAAHDIRNPLTLISSHAQLLGRSLAMELQQGQLLERARSRLTAIQEQVDQLTELTTQLSTIISLQSAKPRPYTETVNLARLLQRCAIDQRVLTPERAVETLIERDPCPIQANQTQLQLILMSLLKNAARYSHPSTPISVSLRCTPANAALWAEVSVRDQGIGMPHASLPHVFERFYRVIGNEQRARAAGIRPPDDEGTSMGVGLYLCKQLIERMGGHIWAESVEGQGTCVSFTLPLKR